MLAEVFKPAPLENKNVDNMQHVPPEWIDTHDTGYCPEETGAADIWSFGVMLYQPPPPTTKERD